MYKVVKENIYEHIFIYAEPNKNPFYVKKVSLVLLL